MAAGITSFVAIFLLNFFYYQTITGLLLQKLPWNEDSFEDRPLAELEKALAKKGVFLEEMYASELPSWVELKPGQSVYRFQKGKRYDWFGMGTAINIGYVIVEADEGSLVERIFHGRSVDSL